MTIRFTTTTGKTTNDRSFEYVPCEVVVLESTPDVVIVGTKHNVTEVSPEITIVTWRLVHLSREAWDAVVAAVGPAAPVTYHDALIGGMPGVQDSPEAVAERNAHNKDRDAANLTAKRIAEWLREHAANHDDAGHALREKAAAIERGDWRKP